MFSRLHVRTPQFFNYILALLFSSSLIFNLVNKTHGSILLATCVIFSGNRALHLFGIAILFIINAKMPLLLIGLSLIILTKVSKYQKLFILLTILYFIYSLIDHWFDYDIHEIWAIQNRLLSLEAYVNYLRSDWIRALFPITPAEIYPRALDIGILVGLTRYGILGFILLAILFIAYLRKYFCWKFVCILMLPFFTQAYLLHPIVFLTFLIMLNMNRSRIIKIDA